MHFLHSILSCYGCCCCCCCVCCWCCSLFTFLPILFHLYFFARCLIFFFSFSCIFSFLLMFYCLFHSEPKFVSRCMFTLYTVHIHNIVIILSIRVGSGSLQFMPGRNNFTVFSNFLYFFFFVFFIFYVFFWVVASSDRPELISFSLFLSVSLLNGKV